MRLLRRLSVVLLAAGISVSVPCLAHRVVEIGGVHDTAGTALVLENPNVSQVAYVELADGRREFWLAVDAAEPMPLYVSLGVPVLDRLADYRPHLAVLGPGLPAIDLSVADGVSARGVVLTPAATSPPDEFFEPVTRTHSWILYDGTVDLPAGGRYYIVAWSDQGVEDGKLWVSVGEKEVFGLSDLVTLPSTIRNVRAFYEISAGITTETMGGLTFLFLFALLVNWALWHPVR